MEVIVTQLAVTQNVSCQRRITRTSKSISLTRRVQKTETLHFFNKILCLFYEVLKLQMLQEKILLLHKPLCSSRCWLTSDSQWNLHVGSDKYMYLDYIECDHFRFYGNCSGLGLGCTLIHVASWLCTQPVGPFGLQSVHWRHTTLYLVLLTSCSR